MIMPATLFCAVVLCVLPITSATNERSAVPVRVQVLAEGVYAVLREEPPGVINESNSMFIVGDDGVIVVDAQSSVTRTLETLAALRRITRKPVRTVVNTHWHDDHVVGNVVYRDTFPGVEIIAHAYAATDLAVDGVRFRGEAMKGRAGTIAMLRSLVQRERSFLGGPLSDEERESHLSSARLLEDYSNASATFMPLAPTRTFTDSLVLREGAREVVLRFVGRGHTRGDIIVHLPRERIVAAGDLLMWPVQFVGSTSFPLDFGSTLDRIRALDARAIVPGHGPVLHDDRHPALVSRMLQSLAAQTRAAVGRGETQEQASKSVVLDEFRDAMAGESPVRRILFAYYVVGSAAKRAYEQALEHATKPPSDR